jgi:hypothetical protein
MAFNDPSHALAYFGLMYKSEASNQRPLLHTSQLIETTTIFTFLAGLHNLIDGNFDCRVFSLTQPLASPRQVVDWISIPGQSPAHSTPIHTQPRLIPPA